MSREESPEFQLLARAAGFLRAARIVVDSEKHNSTTIAPVAHLIAHGLEVLMKHVLLRRQLDLDHIRRCYGHDIAKLWNDEHMYLFRQAAFEEANDAWQRAQQSGIYVDCFEGDPAEELNKQIAELSRLHTKSSHHALRYVSEPDVLVPRPLLLLDTFIPLKDRVARSFSRNDNVL